ncbi:MAG: 8-oxo-dGTP diphosphatase [Actinomycetota bacterium]|nr:8-oxo-dGTP diphosphatase [Actinomycetota bacterium]
MTGPDGRGDGDGWVTCDLGHRHWGIYGAAGLLLHRPTATGDGHEVLLQHRATWSHHGGTWGLLGGARHSDESAVDAALREAAEEGGLSPVGVQVHGRYDDAHGGWSYATALAAADASTEARPTGGESIDVAWVPVDRLDGGEAAGSPPLHPGFAASWPILRDALHPLTVVVDGANVVGSRPDGWWRDRAGAARRLIRACGSLARDGVAGDELPEGLGAVRLTRSWPQVVVAVEGAARGVGDEDAPPGVSVAVATGSGDDEVVAAAQRAAGSGDPARLRVDVLVVTADRGLRDRVTPMGAVCVGPRWLTDRLGSS